MSKPLQQFQNSSLKTRSQTLSLQLKLSLINSTYHERTLNRSPKSPSSPLTISSSTVRPFETTHRHLLDSPTDQIDERIDTLEHSLEIQFNMIGKFKQILKQRLNQYRDSQIIRQKHLNQLILKRKLQIQNLKNQLRIAIRSNIQQREYFFHKIQAQFEHNIQQFLNNWKIMKKHWKTQLKRILNKYQGLIRKQQETKIKPLNNINSSEQRDQNQKRNYCLKELEREIRDHLIISQQQSTKMQLELSSMIQSFCQRQNKAKQQLKNRFGEVLESVQMLQKSIKFEVRKQHRQSEENRQKLLMLFEQNVQRIERKKREQKLQKLKKYKPDFLHYRHLL